MKLRELFRRRAGEPDVPVPEPARHPDWPSMPALQRAISAPSLITAPEEFTGSLASWRNPSRNSTLGHYVTPDAPAGVTDGLAAVSPPPELPTPARPWWWPRPPAVQRHIPPASAAAESTSGAVPGSPESHVESGERSAAGSGAPTPPGSASRAVAIPVRPLLAEGLVSAAGAALPLPRFAVPALQRALDRPAPVPDPSIASIDLPIVDSPPQTPLPPVVTPPTEPTPEASPASTVIPTSSGQPDLPVARRLGLGTPLQRVPDAGGTPRGDEPQESQHQVEVSTRSTDVAPLVSGSPPLVTPTPEPPTPSSAPGPPVQRTVDAAVARPQSSPVKVTAARPLPAGSAPAQGEPSAPPRPVDADAGTDAAPMDLAPLVSESVPMASVAASPTASESVVILPGAIVPGVILPGVIVPGATSAVGEVGTDPEGPNPSSGPSAGTSEPSLPVQRATGTSVPQEPPAGSDLNHVWASQAGPDNSATPSVAGLVGDRPIEPVVSDYPTPVDSAAVPVHAPAVPVHAAPVPAAPAAAQTRWPAVQRHAVGVSVPGVATARIVRGSPPGIDEPASPIPPAPFTATAPVAAPELTTKLVVQRADDASAPPEAPAPTTTTSTGAPAPSTGSISPTDVDTLVRRLYDPIVRRLKTELQLDRERAGHSLDLRH
ncbi:MAG: hypothetical protein ACRDRA_11685 [Pseudonocardiaceae bacterium]